MIFIKEPAPFTWQNDLSRFVYKFFDFVIHENRRNFPKRLGLRL